MLFYCDDMHVYRVRPLEALPWLVHGFGTRHSNGFPDAGRTATLRQVHSSRCVTVRGRTGVVGEGDALVENTQGVFVGVKTADCIPILLIDERNRAVAAVHAGWRGTAARVGPEAVKALAHEFGTCPEDLHVAIGPGIGPCCYEVGPEVVELLRVEPCASGGRLKINLEEINRRQLEDVGVPHRRLYAAHLCTMCNGEFHSYRRDRERAGRMISAVGIR